MLLTYAGWNSNPAFLKLKNNAMDKIRIGVLGNEWAIKIETISYKSGSNCNGWRVMERGFKTREEAVLSLRKLINTGSYQEG